MLDSKDSFKPDPSLFTEHPISYFHRWGNRALQSGLGTCLRWHSGLVTRAQANILPMAPCGWNPPFNTALWPCRELCNCVIVVPRLLWLTSPLALGTAGAFRGLRKRVGAISALPVGHGSKSSFFPLPITRKLKQNSWAGERWARKTGGEVPLSHCLFPASVSLSHPSAGKPCNPSERHTQDPAEQS